MAIEAARLTDQLISEVGTREPLPQEEEARLSRLIAEGKEARARLAEQGLQDDVRRRLEEIAERGREALGTLVTHNLPLVVRMTRRYRWSGVSTLDLFQEGALGLLRAAERFDWTRGTPFGAYASWWVRHAMTRAVREATTSVRLSDAQRRAHRSLAQARVADPSASWEVLAERAGVDPSEARHLVPLLGPPVSLDAPVGPDGAVSLADLLADREAEEDMEEVLVEAEADHLLRLADRELSARERLVLEARYGLGGREPLTLREIGEELDLSPQRVAQIEQRAIEKLRSALGIRVAAS